MALSRVVSEIFNVEKCRDLEIGVERRILGGQHSEINGDFRRKSHGNRQFYPPPMYLTPSFERFPMELGIGAGSEETRMMGLPDGRKSFKIGLAVLIQYRRVMDTQPASRPASHVALASTRYAYLRRAVKILTHNLSKVKIIRTERIYTVFSKVGTLRLFLLLYYRCSSLCRFR